MEKHEKSLKEPGKLRQFLATVVVNLSSLCYGIMLGWQSPFAPQLQSPLPPVGSEPMTDDGVSWLSGIMCLAGTVVTVLLSVIPDKFSRKRFGYVLVIPMTLSWLLIIFATEHIHIYIAKALCGIGGAGMFFLVPNYISEISCDSIRGLLGTVMIFSINVGILIVYILGGILSFRSFAMVALTVPVLYLIAFAFMPESPVYLVRQNRMHDAIRSLKWLKNKDSLTIEQTLSYLQLEVKKATSTNSAKLSDLFRDKATIKGLIIVLGLFGGQQFCGITAMINYTESIFKISGSSLTPNASAIIVAVIQLFGTFLSLFLVERAGRRPLLLISCAGMFVCHCVIGTFCYLQDLQYEVSAYGWVPVTALSIFVVAYSLGMGGLPVVVMSEIFSRDVSSLGTIVGLTMGWTTSFIVVKIFADLITLLGMYGCFFLLATSCACSSLFCFVFVPETKGRMREDIVDQLNGVQCTKKDVKHVIGTDSMHAANV
nr:PREDICTED: facilitated trehalose transporter Tret1-like [Linepithema humile]